MKRTEKDALYLYLINNLTRLEGDLTMCQNNMRYRRVDEVDCLEMAIAVTRLRMFQEFSRDVSAILKIYDDDLKERVKK